MMLLQHRDSQTEWKPGKGKVSLFAGHIISIIIIPISSQIFSSSPHQQLPTRENVEKQRFPPYYASISLSVYLFHLFSSALERLLHHQHHHQKTLFYSSGISYYRFTSALVGSYGSSRNKKENLSENQRECNAKSRLPRLLFFSQA